MTRPTWTARYTLKRLLWVAFAGALVAGLSLPVSVVAFSIQNPPQTFWPRVFVLLPRLSTVAALLGTGVWLIRSATSAIRRGVDDGRWENDQLESLRRNLERTDWPIFLAFALPIWFPGFLRPYHLDSLFFPAFVLMRTHTSVSRSLNGNSFLPQTLHPSRMYLRAHRLGTLARAKTI
jgi:hypothetical protein